MKLINAVKTSLGLDVMNQINIKTLSNIPQIPTLAFTPLFNNC